MDKGNQDEVTLLEKYFKVYNNLKILYSKDTEAAVIFHFK